MTSSFWWTVRPHALAELVRERWFRRTGQRIPPTPVDTDPWPGAVQPDITDVDVVIARTEPAYAGRPEVRRSRLSTSTPSPRRGAIY